MEYAFRLLQVDRNSLFTEKVSILSWLYICPFLTIPDPIPFSLMLSDLQGHLPAIYLLCFLRVLTFSNKHKWMPGH